MDDRTVSGMTEFLADMKKVDSLPENVSGGGTSLSSPSRALIQESCAMP